MTPGIWGSAGAGRRRSCRPAERQSAYLARPALDKLRDRVAGRLHLEELRKTEPPLAVRLAHLAWPIAVGLARLLNVAALLYAAIHSSRLCPF